MGPLLTSRELDQKIVGLVARSREEHGITEGCEGETACAKLGLELCRAPLPPGTAGILSGNRAVVDLNIRWAPRTEFTIYHEITHHLIEEDGEIIEHFTELLRHDPRPSTGRSSVAATRAPRSSSCPGPGWPRR